MSLKDIYLQNKLDKTKKLVMDMVRRSSGVDEGFKAFDNKPTLEQYVNMVCASKYGPGDPLSEGPDGFGLEYIIDEFNESISFVKNKPITIINEDGEGIAITSSQSELWANLLFTFYLDETFMGFINKLDNKDFHELEKYPSVFVDNESNSLALDISWCVIPIRDIQKEPCLQELRIGEQFQPIFYPTKFKNNRNFYWYQIKISTLDVIIEAIEREKHSVKSHDRNLESGKIVIVKSHERRNPIIIKRKKINTEEFGFIVYRVRDSDGVIRYYGEGQENRPSHVNSGCSHNFKINEHFFTKGPMKVEILKEGLSKQEALVIEKFLINGHTGSVLWNIKDYEP